MIVEMTRAHIDQLMPFEQVMFGPEAWSAAAYREELADRRHRHYVAAVAVDGSLTGWAGVRVLGEDAEILTVGVVPASRRQGLATELLAALLDHARRRGAHRAFLEVRVDNPGAIGLYEREGFVRVGGRRGYYENGTVDAAVMSRAL